MPFDSAPSKVTQKLTSGNLSWEIGTLYALSLAGRNIELIRAKLVCTTAASGYIVGDEVDIAASNTYFTTFGVAVYVSNGYLMARVASAGIGIRDAATGAPVYVSSSANFKLVLEAYGY